MGRWVWQLMRPGISTMPVASMIFCGCSEAGGGFLPT